MCHQRNEEEGRRDEETKRRRDEGIKGEQNSFLNSGDPS